MNMMPFNYEVVSNDVCDKQTIQSYYNNWTEQGANLLDLYCCGFSCNCITDQPGTNFFITEDCQSSNLLPGGRVLIKTGIKIELPVLVYTGEYRWYSYNEAKRYNMQPKDYSQARIESRSGLALKHGIQAFNGIIDQEYRQEIGVILFNYGHEPYTIKIGDRIAQMQICPVEVAQPTLVDKIQKTERGGFGSSGK